MAVINITNFAGLIPRLLARELPPDASQVNDNLLASSVQFRPLQEDAEVTIATTNAKTLYRLSRNASGVLRTSDADGWITDANDLNYVRGQVADDAIERTFYTRNDGTDYPKATDISGTVRRLGVPAPVAKPVCTLNLATQFTLEDANNWVSATLLDAVKTAVTSHIVEGRFTGSGTSGASVAGVTSLHGGTLPTTPTSQRNGSEDFNLLYPVATSTATTAKLIDPQLDVVNVGSDSWFAINCLPYWGRITDMTGFTAALRVILNPKDGSQLWTDAQLTGIATELAAYFDPDSIKAKRQSLDDAVAAFKTAMDFVLTPPPTAPTVPTKPTSQEWDFNGIDGTSTRTTAWVTYDADMATYNTNLLAYNKAIGQKDSDAAARIATMVAAMKQAEALSHEIDGIYYTRKQALDAAVNDWISGRGLVKSDTNPTGLVAVDPNRIVEERFYAVTFMTDWGEESAPSPVSDLLEPDQNDTVTVARPTVPGGRHIAKWNLYRTNSGNIGTDFQLVDVMLIATTAYTDAKKAAELGEPCPSAAWAEPPYRMDTGSGTYPNFATKGADPYMRGLVGMANGVMAGFVDNFVAFSEPYAPYAWPVQYQIPLKYEVVGLGAFGSTVFVGTTGRPSLISGSDSASMSAQELDESQACVSAKSIVCIDGGAFYASPDGLCYASQGGVEVISDGLFTREDWQKLDPKSIIGFTHDGIYYFSYTGNGGGAYSLDRKSRKLTSLDMRFTAVHSDVRSDGLFFVNGPKVYRALTSGRRTGKWKSPKQALPSQSPLAWLRVMGDQSDAAPVTVTWFGDGEQRYQVAVADIEPVRLPPGRYLEHEVQIESKARITRVILASSTEELKQTV